MHPIRVEAFRTPLAHRACMNGLVALLLLLCLVVWPGSSHAAEFLTGDSPILPETAEIDDDLYVAGGMVRISGNVRGDLVVAGGNVEIEGDVGGDLLAAGGTIRVSGAVAGTIRAAGGQITLLGPIGEDLVVTGGSISVGSRARVGRDLVASGGEVDLAAPIGRRAQIAAGQARIGADVGGDVAAQVGSLELGPIRIGGELAYPEDTEAEIDRGAVIEGGVVRTEPLGDGGDGWGFGSILFLLARLLVGLWALGALFTLAAPGWSARAADVQLQRPGLAVLGGLAILLVTPLAAGLVFVIGLLIGGWWIGLILFALYFIALVLALPIAALAIGRAIASRVGGRRPWAWPLLLLAGLVVLVVLFAIPIFGVLVALVAMLFGLGGLVLGARSRRMPPAPLPG